jgi:methionyl-tRNA synthetase
VDFDNYHSTHAEENRELSSQIYLAARRRAHRQRSMTQYFDPEKEMFLADRFIKGTCPKCGTKTSTATTAKNAARPTPRPS